MAFRNNSYRLDFFRPGAAAASFTGFARNLASRHPTNLATISANHDAVYRESIRDPAHFWGELHGSQTPKMDEALHEDYGLQYG